MKRRPLSMVEIAMGLRTGKISKVQAAEILETMTDLEEIKRILQRACDRDWKDETLYQTAVIASNAIYWRDDEIARLKALYE